MTTAFVLGGGGVLGTTQIGMLRALAEQGIRPDVVLGTSIGALNGAFVAANPSVEGITALADLWRAMGSSGIFLENPMRSAARIARFRTHILSSKPLRKVIDEHLPVDTFEELDVDFQCVAACIETADAQWFSSGELVDPVIASCTVPGLFPPVVIDGRHYLDGGLVHSIPVGRAVQLGADRIFVLQVGRVEQPLTPPRRPWEVGIVAFEIGRRHRFVHEMAEIPDDVEVHVLPSGAPETPSVAIGYGRTSRLTARAEQAYAASSAYLADL
ncbi:NTE family protein [Knoellia remsis]|uniref:NTE family protein n=1 Tax=Knoellia remsis TaxID=407159 RepID=A0A2T0UCL9_9MICO|nr:patatin-like phospholipase family protein [Knoellia remsis]PRY55634.1 NTE family protein [Knoellia remsis]